MLPRILTLVAALAAATLPLGAGARPAMVQDQAVQGRATPVAAVRLSPRWSPPFMRPLEVSEHYRAPLHRFGAGHRGIDVPASAGETIMAPASGIVSFAGRVVDRDVVTVRVDARTLVSLEPVTSSLAVGTGVHQGLPLGTVSTGGHCDGECVHLGVRVGSEADGRDYVNPLRFYLDKPVLLPW